MKQSAKKLRESATDIKEALDEVEGYLAQLNNLAAEVIKLCCYHMLAFKGTVHSQII